MFTLEELSISMPNGIGIARTRVEVPMLSTIVEVLTIWFFAAALGAMTFVAFAASQKKLARHEVWRHRRS